MVWTMIGIGVVLLVAILMFILQNGGRLVREHKTGCLLLAATHRGSYGPTGMPTPMAVWRP
jgi:hypothetical protein